MRAKIDEMTTCVPVQVCTVTVDTYCRESDALAAVRAEHPGMGWTSSNPPNGWVAVTQYDLSIGLGMGTWSYSFWKLAPTTGTCHNLAPVEVTA